MAKIVFNEDDVIVVAKALGKSRGVEHNFVDPFTVKSAVSDIYSEALRVVAALRDHHGN